MNLSKLTKSELVKMATQKCKHGHSFLEHPSCYQPREKERIGFLDIETSNLNADFGIILSYAIKEPGKRPFGALITKAELMSDTHDKRVVGECIEDIKKFDRIYTYYGSRFDVPYIRSRAMLWGLDFPIYQEVQHTDIFYWCRSKLCLHRKRLQTVCDFLGIPAKEHPMEPNMWTKALTGDAKSLRYIMTHNLEDVVSLEEVYLRLIDYVADRSNSL